MYSYHIPCIFTIQCGFDLVVHSLNSYNLYIQPSQAITCIDPQRFILNCLNSTVLLGIVIGVIRCVEMIRFDNYC